MQIRAKIQNGCFSAVQNRIRARLEMTIVCDCFFQRFYEKTEDRQVQFVIGYKLIPHTRPKCTAMYCERIYYKNKGF